MARVDLITTRNLSVEQIDKLKELIADLPPPGSDKNPYKISSIDDLLKLKSDVAGGECFEGKCFEQTQDIDMSGVLWDGIGLKNGDGPDMEHTFKGIYDGGSHVINNLKFVYDSSGDNELLGFFRSCVSATIKNLTINVVGFDVPSSPSENFGGAAFVGTACNGITMINCTANGSIGTESCPCLHTSAGLVANIELPVGIPSGVDRHTMYKSVLSFVTNNANVYSARKAGGIIGLASHDVELNHVVNNGGIHHLFVKTNKTTDGVGAIIGHGSGNGNGWYQIFKFNGIINTGSVDSNRNVRTDIIGQLVGAWGADDQNRSTNVGDIKMIFNPQALPLASNTSGNNISGMNLQFGEIKSDGFCHVVNNLVASHEYVYLLKNQGEGGTTMTPPTYALTLNNGESIIVDCKFGEPRFVLASGSTGNVIKRVNVSDTRWMYSVSRE